MGLEEFLTNVMYIVISDFYIIISLYTIRHTIVKMIRQRRNSDNSYLQGVTIDEWKELEAM